MPVAPRRLASSFIISANFSPAEKGPKVFSPVLRREDAALGETKDFLDRVYQGSLSLMVSALTKKQALSREELDELYELLKGLEEERHD